MKVREYFDEKPPQARSLDDGVGDYRNTHNFLKACLISSNVLPRSHLLDLGCGRGGDFLKYKRCQLKSYCGIDLSHENIQQAAARAASSGIKCRVQLQCMDFTAQSFLRRGYYDVVSAQFSLHFAFQSRESASGVVRQVSDNLRADGVFIGTIPIHVDKKTHDMVTVRLPGDDRAYEEFCATSDDVVALCAEHGLACVFWVCFDAYFSRCAAEFPDLQACMHAFASPDANNAAFMFRKIGSPAPRTAGGGE